MTHDTKCHVFDDGGNFPDTFMTFENVQAFLRITAILVVEAVWDLDALNQEDAAAAESELEGVRKVVDVVCRRIEAVEKYLEQWRECEAFQNHIAEFDQFIKEARGEVAEMNEKIKEAEEKLKEAREASEASEVKLSDLDPEEWEDCKGMWVMGEYYNGEVFEGIIFSFYQDDVLVRIPKSGSHKWRRADQLILLPDHQRAFTSTGDPIKVDHGQWEKTHAMEEEFDTLQGEAMTPEEARELLKGTTPGPWYAISNTPFVSIVEEDSEDGEIFDFPDDGEDGPQPDHDLIAAAPVLAETIAGMQAEYAVQVQSLSDNWYYYNGRGDWQIHPHLARWFWSAQDAHALIPYSQKEKFRIVRRYVTDVEGVEES